jgi:hypothetical protein
MKDEQIRVVVKTVGGDWEIRVIPNTLKALQGIVGGIIECVNLSPYHVLVCNEEGRINGMKFNCNVGGHQIFGDFLVAETDGEEFVSLDEHDAECVAWILRK